MKKIKDLKIKRFVERGNFSERVGTVGDLLSEASGLLDDSCASDIIGGGILFQCSDGKWYTASTEVVVTRASAWFVDDTLSENGIEPK